MNGEWFTTAQIAQLARLGFEQQSESEWIYSDVFGRWGPYTMTAEKMATNPTDAQIVWALVEHVIAHMFKLRICPNANRFGQLCAVCKIAYIAIDLINKI